MDWILILGFQSQIVRMGWWKRLLVLQGSCRRTPPWGKSFGSFTRMVGKGECIELLGRMGKDELVRESLYLYERMGLHESSLVTPSSCLLLFPDLGRVGTGDKLMVVFENLLRERKRFRDVCVYNAAIPGVSFCGRVNIDYTYASCFNEMITFAYWLWLWWSNNTFKD